MGLRNQLIKNSSGQLSQTSDEELQKASNSIGRAAAPTNPLEAQVLTGNPDVAKMAGTQANKLNALRQSLRNDMDLQTQQRQRQDKQGEADPAKKAAVQGLELAGQLEGRVPQLAAQIFQKGTTELGIDDTKLSTKRAQGVDDATWQSAQAAATKIATGAGTSADFAALAKGMGKLQVTQEDLASLMKGSPEAITAAIQKATPDTALISQLYTPEEVAQLGGTLGVSATDMATLNVKQLQDKVQAFNQEKLSNTAKLQAMANNPDASPVERAQARRLLAESGASGERVIENDAKTLEQKIQSGDTINFMGQEMTLEEALSDKNVAGAIKRFFEEPDYASKLQEENPALFDIIKSSEGEFAAAVGDVNQAAVAYNKIQEDNQNISKLPDGLSVPDDVMKKLIPGWGSPSEAVMQTPPIIQALKSDQVTPQSRTAIVQALKTYSNAPGILEQLKDISVEDFERLGLNSPDALELINDAATSILIRDDAGSTAAQLNPEQYLQNIFGAGLKELGDSLDTYKAVSAFSGNPDAKKLVTILDANGDGKIDDPLTIQTTVNSLPKGNLKDYLSGNVSTPKDFFGAAKTSLNNLPPVFAKLKANLANGDISGIQISKLTEQGQLDYQDLVDLGKTNIVSSDWIALNIRTQGEQQLKKQASSLIKEYETNTKTGNLNQATAASADSLIKQLQDVADASDVPNIKEAALTKISTLQKLKTQHAVKNNFMNSLYAEIVANKKGSRDIDSQMKEFKKSGTIPSLQDIARDLPPERIAKLTKLYPGLLSANSF